MSLLLFVSITAHAEVITTGNVTPSPTTWNQSTLVRIGETSDGAVAVDGGSQVESSTCDIGCNSGVTGAVTITGSESAWTSSHLILGDNGIGNLEVTDGGTVSSNMVDLGFGSVAVGTATISGSGSTWNCGFSLDVGFMGTGHINITDGGTVRVGGQTYRSVALSIPPPVEMYGQTWLGREEGSMGSIYFDSGTLMTGGLCAGVSELTGTGTIYTNGLVSDVDLLFDATHGMSKTLTLDSLPNQNITIYLEQGSDAALGAGYTGAGSLTIRDGITLESIEGCLGYKAGSSGTGSVSGSGSTWNVNGDLHVGRCGTGQLNITDDAVVNVTGRTLLAGPKAWPDWPGVTERGTGSIHFDSGTLNTNGLCAGVSELTGTGTINTTGLLSDVELLFDATHGASQTITLNDLPGQNVTIHLEQSATAPIAGAGYRGNGSLTIKDGIEIKSASGCLGYHAGSSGTATVSGVGSTWAIQNDLVIGDQGTGELNVIHGGLVTVFSLEVDCDGDGDSFINMSTGGMLALEGDMGDSVTSFFNRVRAAEAIRWWDTSIHDWALLTTAELGTGYTLEYLTEGDLAGYTLLTVETVRVPGDANGDGRVDGSDVTILASNWQQGIGIATWEMGDFNGDGRVDGSDVTILAGNWQYGMEAASTAVPEPSGVALLLTALLAAGLVPTPKTRDGKRR